MVWYCVERYVEWQPTMWSYCWPSGILGMVVWGSATGTVLGQTTFAFAAGEARPSQAAVEGAIFCNLACAWKTSLLAGVESP